MRCPLPSGARNPQGFGDPQGRRKPVSAAFAIHVKSDHIKGVSGESFISLSSRTM